MVKRLHLSHIFVTSQMFCRYYWNLEGWEHRTRCRITSKLEENHSSKLRKSVLKSTSSGPYLFECNYLYCKIPQPTHQRCGRAEMWRRGDVYRYTKHTLTERQNTWRSPSLTNNCFFPWKHPKVAVWNYDGARGFKWDHHYTKKKRRKAKKSISIVTFRKALESGSYIIC